MKRAGLRRLSLSVSRAKNMFAAPKQEKKEEKKARGAHLPYSAKKSWHPLASGGLQQEAGGSVPDR